MAWQSRTGGEGVLRERRGPERYGEAVRSRMGRAITGGKRSATAVEDWRGVERTGGEWFGRVRSGSHGVE